MPIRNSEPKLLLVEHVDIIILVTTSFDINMHQISWIKVCSQSILYFQKRSFKNLKYYILSAMNSLKYSKCQPE